MEVNISTKLKFENILYGCLRQVGCLIRAISNSGLTVNVILLFEYHKITYLNVPHDVRKLSSVNDLLIFITIYIPESSNEVQSLRILIY